ncbi:hypothetical protein PG996_002912 [Apiospora saccharicola]|uniref:NACHT domain-containing protein n=1 Tax=Apiospora saccharicola TaxID=335842 RepID=A0ABR1WKS3_9PEZI
MDPFAAMGAASAIITFLDFGATIVKTAKEIHASESGASSHNADLETLTKKMNELSIDLKPLKSPSDMSASEKALLEVCIECEGLTTDLQSVLDDMKPKRPRNKRSSTAATVRILKNADKVKELDSKLEKCRSIFQIQLGRITRQELGQRLDDIAKTGNALESEMKSLGKNTDLLRSGIIVTSFEPSAIEQIRQLLAQSDRAIDRAGQVLILKHLKDGSMGLRFFDIPEAHSQTLAWIFDGLDESMVDPFMTDQNSWCDRSDPTEVTVETFNAMKLAREDYVSWLRGSPMHTKDTIFHISGKPGAGKSTLMKYLRKHQVTSESLEDWSGGKTPIICHYFAWHPGNPVQNTIRGLLITILYTILQQAPELCKVAFETQWQRVKADHLIDSDPEEIKRGLNAILMNKNTFNTYRFCIFIDGLDEFREEPEDVIGLIWDWATIGGSNMKLLQDINRRDIALRVKDGLESIEEFETREEKAEILALGYDLTEKSEGVFLWVKLALNTVRESVMSRESAADIARKINELPRELEDAFQYIFDSMKNHRLHTERRRAMLTLRFVIDYPTYLRKRHMEGFPLLRYSFLDEYDNNHRFAQKGRLNQWSESELVSRLNRAQKQVVRRCFGLVEVTNSNFGQSKVLSFLHRAVSEFMHRDRISRDMYVLTADFDMAGFTCQCFLATTKFISLPNHYYSAPSHPIFNGETMYLNWLDPLNETYEGSHYMNNLSYPDSEVTLSQFQYDLLKTLDLSLLPSYGKSPTMEAFIHDLVVTGVSSSQSGYEVSFRAPEYGPHDYFVRCGIADAVLLVVCSSGLLELVQPTLLLSQQRTQEKSLPGSKPSMISLDLLLWYTLASLKGNASEQCTFNILDFLFLTWCPDTADLVNDRMWEPTYWPGLWRKLVWSGFWNDSKYLDDYVAPLEPIIRIFLLYGATPDLSFRITRYLKQECCYWMVNSLDPQDTITSCFGKGEVKWNINEQPWPTPEYEGMNHVIIRRGLLSESLETYLLNNPKPEYTFSLHQLVELWFPLHRAKSLQYLIDQTIHRGRPPCREEVLAMKANKDLDIDI